MWPYILPDEEDKFSSRKEEYPFQVVLGEEGPDPRMVWNNMDVDLIYIKRGVNKVYAFKTQKDAVDFEKIYK